jgi:hypothetical protein
VGRSTFVARRLGVFGLGAVVAGGVLLGTGVAVSAQTTAKAAVAPNKKKTTTTTSTTTTTTTPTTTVALAPCSPVPTTATGVNTSVTPNTTATLTMTPGTCITSGTVVTISGSGFQPSSAGTWLECNSDPNQPTVGYPAPGDNIPISCTDPFSPPGVTVTGAGGTAGPVKFTILEATQGVGPPCGPCTGTAATDSSGGNTATDAKAYPCPPTAAQITAGDTCGIIFGDQAGDGVTVPISFNTKVAIPTTVPTTMPATPTATVAPAGKGAGAKPKAKATSTSTSTKALAFTGSGPGLWWLALVGMVLMALGVLALTVVDEPRRIVRLVLSRVSRSGPRTP